MFLRIWDFKRSALIWRFVVKLRAGNAAAYNNPTSVEGLLWSQVYPLNPGFVILGESSYCEKLHSLREKKCLAYLGLLLC